MRRAAWFDEVSGWIAAAIAIAIEGALVWWIDRLPVWAHLVVYGIPAALLVAGLAVLVRVRVRRGRRAGSR